MVSYINLNAPEVKERELEREGSLRRGRTSKPIPKGLKALVEAEIGERGTREQEEWRTRE